MFELELAHPWLLLLILLPLPIRLLSAFRQSGDSVLAPFFQRLQSLSGEKPREGSSVLKRSRVQAILLLFSWSMLVLAAAKPELPGAPIVQTQSARDLMVAVDLSGSMSNRDFNFAVKPGAEAQDSVDRLTAVKTVLSQLAEERPHDRLGLMVFGEAPYLQVPFTDDHATWKALLAETEISMAGESTVIGDAIGLSIKLFLRSDVQNRVLILLTDGNDTGSQVPPIDAAKIARSYDIKIYCIAIGDPQSVGEEALDIATLQRVAELTGGDFFQAMNPEELVRVQDAIAAQEPEMFESLSYQPRRTLHYLPIAALVLIFLCYATVAMLWRRGAQTRAEVSHV